MTVPVLYSFRRCPYAMRARLALIYAGVDFELREISLRDKPADMLEVSPKGTVPVLVLEEARVIDESLEIMRWALEQNDPEGWGVDIKDALILENDTVFKKALDRYKYPNRFPDEDCSGAFDDCVQFLDMFEKFERKSVLVEMAILPFIRQFSKVDVEKFESLDIPQTQQWLEIQLKSALFLSVMKKQPLWKK